VLGGGVMGGRIVGEQMSVGEAGVAEKDLGVFLRGFAAGPTVTGARSGQG
jgi:hypothetical protein